VAIRSLSATVRWEIILSFELDIIPFVAYLTRPEKSIPLGMIGLVARVRDWDLVRGERR
jgi:hypothetical protein